MGRFIAAIIRRVSGAICPHIILQIRKSAFGDIGGISRRWGPREAANDAAFPSEHAPLSARYVYAFDVRDVLAGPGLAESNPPEIPTCGAHRVGFRDFRRNPSHFAYR